MKIGVLTLFNAVNYGAYLQAYCLQEIIKKIGFNDVKMIKTSSVLYEKWRMKALLTYKPSRMLFKFRLLWGYEKIWKKLKKGSTKENYDLIIVGSDEMWNLKNITVKALPEFFGHNLRFKKIISYAVSCNNTTSEDVKNCDFVKSGIDKFSAVSVRDEATFQAYSILRSDIRIDLDPTFLVDLNDYLIPCRESDYILVYTYGFKKHMIESVKSLSKELNKKIICVGQNFAWADKCVPANAFEFLGYIKNADVIVTDTFHGTVLSIELNKNFVSYAGQKPKVKKILEQLDLQKRNADGKDNLSEIYNAKIDYKKVNEKIRALREKSLAYLTEEITNH